MAKVKQHYGSTSVAYAAGFLPLPLATTGWLMYRASSAAHDGSTQLFLVLLAAIPGALVLGPLNVRATLRGLADPLAQQTAKASAKWGVAGLVAICFPFGFLVALGWIGLIADLALVAFTVPGVARSNVLQRLQTERQAAKLRGS
jgi:hypothetical protein